MSRDKATKIIDAVSAALLPFVVSGAAYIALRVIQGLVTTNLGE